MFYNLCHLRGRNCLSRSWVIFSHFSFSGNCVFFSKVNFSKCFEISLGRWFAGSYFNWYLLFRWIFNMLDFLLFSFDNLFFFILDLDWLRFYFNFKRCSIDNWFCFYRLFTALTCSPLWWRRYGFVLSFRRRNCDRRGWLWLWLWLWFRSCYCFGWQDWLVLLSYDVFKFLLFWWLFVFLAGIILAEGTLYLFWLSSSHASHTNSMIFGADNEMSPCGIIMSLVANFTPGGCIFDVAGSHDNDLVI
jgi:hypothetical protein